MFSISNKKHLIFVLPIFSSLFLSLVDGILYHAYGLFISTLLIGIGLAYAWPKNSNSLAGKQAANRHYSLCSILILSLVTILLYYSLFIYQLYQSKNGCVDEDWINWNAQYPIYFSPTWSYERYSIDEIEDLKKIYVLSKKYISCLD